MGVEENDLTFEVAIEKLENIAVLNAPCGNVIIQLYPNVSPNSVHDQPKCVSKI